MSESDILPEGPSVNLTAAEVEETVTQSMPDYHEGEDLELHMAIRMSLEEPDAETTDGTMGDTMPIDKEEQAELDQALFLSNLPPDMGDEQLAILHQARLNGANSAKDILDLVHSAEQLLECGEPDAVSKVIGLLDRAVGVAPEGSDLKASLVRGLSDIETEAKVNELHSSAIQLMELFQQSGDWNAIDNAVQLMEEVIKLTPDGHADKAEWLNNLGTAFQSRFQRLGELKDIENAIDVKQQAVNLTPDGHADKAGRLNNLGNALQSRFQRLGELKDIENAIDVNRQAVDLTPDGHADKARRLNNLGNALQSRFECLGELKDIENAIHVKQQAVDLTPDGHADKAGLLNNLGTAFTRRFVHLGKLKDIKNAIDVNQQAIDLTPDGHADKAGLLNNLGTAFSRRFARLGELKDIENAIVVKRQAVDLTPDGHADKAGLLNNLGTAFQNIENAIHVMQQAVNLTLDGHAVKAGLLNNLGNAFQSRFEHLGELKDIENAIDVNQQAVDLTPDGHADKAALLNNLGTAFQSRFECLGELKDIENAIHVKQQAIDLTPVGHADKAGRLNNLGNALQSRFERLGELKDIENGIDVNRQAVNLTLDGHADKAARLNNLGNIENAIDVKRQAVDLTPDGHADKAGLLNNLGNALQSRFERLGELKDMENVFHVMQQAVDLTPDGHADKARRLNNLGTALQSRFERLGELTDIENAIHVMQQAVDLTPDGHADKAGQLNNLGTAFSRRFERLGELKDIENAIDVKRQAVDLTPDGHADKAGRLNNLGNALQSQFERLVELKDIENAIDVKRQAVDLTLDGHADKAGWLTNLGNALQSRFEHLGELKDIENAIDVKRQAVDLTPDGHVDKAGWLNNLGTAFSRRFERLGELKDIENAIDVKRQAIDLTLDGHADKAALLNNLGNAFQSRFERLGELKDITEAAVAYKQAAENTSSRPSTRYVAACRWAILCSEYQSPSSALAAYTVVLEIIPQVVRVGQTVHRRYEELPKIGQTINAAAAMAISAGDLPRAVAWLEEGRSIVWKQLLQLRTPLDELPQQHPDLADELSRISLALDNAGTSKLQDIDSEIKHRSVEEEAQNHCKLAAKYEQLLKEVRELDGFGSFLRPKKFSELAPAARNGPVVVVNVAKLHCDALVLCTSGEIVHVPLSKFSYTLAEALRSKLLSSLQAHGVRPILSELEQALYKNAHHSLPHITWCATGALAFLPLHAAGIYGSSDPTKDMNISDFAVSSYTTTLTAMLVSGSKPKQDPTQNPNILIVSQPGTPNMPPLPGTVKEVEVIQHYASPDHTCHLTHEFATVDAVLGQMGKHEIIHLACHGIQDIKNPLSSAFALYDGRLELNALMRLSLENAELAVLSACQTATGDENLPEEAVHLAAGMLAVGYPSVIATMWSIGDKDAPLIADKVYANLLGRRDNSESQEVKLAPAYALHEAVKHLREEVGETNFVKWVPFIHFGV
ncbi:TPR-like protein [Dendrothele bispora CBS 962.96]|uniref:TPR-like protein n=1 Tax=Dendrothele bispora (strain CBS 962.96) TaxID=1314807 RepID=A0A4S8LZF5_DENBC|nr:TPR-like protein [Dendrothele bispora CBS 962.96]